MMLRGNQGASTYLVHENGAEETGKRHTSGQQELEQ